MAVPGFFFKIEHGLFRVIGLKLAGEPQGVFDLSRFSLLPFIVPPYLYICKIEEVGSDLHHQQQHNLNEWNILEHSITFYYILLHSITFYYML